ncbi:MAG: hypothetical protein HY549_10515 [Elusimicrobia bacterium]|nr:hypothetical protein [Elusimicrobiota bacterium]
MRGKQSLKTTLRLDQRMALLGRLRMAEWIEMPEQKFAQEIEKIEKDPLFQKLFYGKEGSAIRRQKWAAGRFSGSFYEVNEQVAAGSQRVRVEEKLDEKQRLLPKIRKIGQEAFERYFLYAEEPLPLEEIARRTGLPLEDIQAINQLLLEIGSEAEFAGPPPGTATASFSCLARLSIEAEEPIFEFFSPHWARGLYNIRYEKLEQWKRDGMFQPAEMRRLPHLLKRMETVNLRQNTLYRVMETVTKLQAEFLKTRRKDLLRPISLRKLAWRLDLAPSTVSRALSGRGVKLPWGQEVPLIKFLPGRRRVLRDVLSQWLEKDGRAATDSFLAQRLREEYGIKVSRRTVNAVRNELGRSKKTA